LIVVTPASQPKKKKPLAERIKEKEEKRRLEKLAKEEVSTIKSHRCFHNFVLG